MQEDKERQAENKRTKAGQRRKTDKIEAKKNKNGGKHVASL